MVTKAKWILFEGPDRAGKTTIIDALYNARQRIDVIHDRGILTCALYNPPLGGEKEHLDMLREWLKLPFTYLIIIDIDYDTHYKRSLYSNHPVDNYDDFEVIRNFYLRYGRELYREFPDKIEIIDGTMSQGSVLNTCLAFLSQDEK